MQYSNYSKETLKSNFLHGYFVSRSTGSAFDMEKADFTNDQDPHDYDFSDIVPSNARAILIRFRLTDGTAGAEIRVGYPSAFNEYNWHSCRVNVANKWFDFQVWIPNEAGIIRMEANLVNPADFSYIQFRIIGWLL